MKPRRPQETPRRPQATQMKPRRSQEAPRGAQRASRKPPASKMKPRTLNSMGRRRTSYEEGAHLRRRPVFEAHRTHETQARAQFMPKNAKNPTDFHCRGAGTATGAGFTRAEPYPERPPPQNESFSATNSSRKEPQPLHLKALRSGGRSGQVGGQLRSGRRSGRRLRL